LSENGKGNAEDIIEFDTLDLDEDKSGSNKITELQSFLKETLKPDKYSDAMRARKPGVASKQFRRALETRMRNREATLINFKRRIHHLMVGGCEHRMVRSKPQVSLSVARAVWQ